MNSLKMNKRIEKGRTAIGFLYDDEYGLDVEMFTKKECGYGAADKSIYLNVAEIKELYHFLNMIIKNTPSE